MLVFDVRVAGNQVAQLSWTTATSEAASHRRARPRHSGPGLRQSIHHAIRRGLARSRGRIPIRSTPHRHARLAAARSSSISDAIPGPSSSTVMATVAGSDVDETVTVDVAHVHALSRRLPSISSTTSRSDRHDETGRDENLDAQLAIGVHHAALLPRARTKKKKKLASKRGSSETTPHRSWGTGWPAARRISARSRASTSSMRKGFAT